MSQRETTQAGADLGGFVLQESVDRAEWVMATGWRQKRGKQIEEKAKKH